MTSFVSASGDTPEPAACRNPVPTGEYAARYHLVHCVPGTR